MPKLVLRRDAQRDLSEIDAFGVERFGEAVADKYMDEMRAALRRLLTFPKLGPHYPGINPPIRYLACGSHLIFYDHDDQADSMIIIRVIHQARDVRRLLAGAR